MRHPGEGSHFRRNHGQQHGSRAEWAGGTVHAGPRNGVWRLGDHVLEARPEPVNIIPAQLQGRLFNDANNDGLSGIDEKPLSGWTVRLLDTAGKPSSRPRRGADGKYDFFQVDPGDYQTVVEVKPGWHQTTPAPGKLTAAPDQTLADIDFGMYLVPTAVQGLQFHDRNGNGTQDPGEEGLNGWEIKLYDAQGQEIASTLTQDIDVDGDGRSTTRARTYEFTGLRPASTRSAKRPVPIGCKHRQRLTIPAGPLCRWRTTATRHDVGSAGRRTKRIHLPYDGRHRDSRQWSCSIAKPEQLKLS